MADTGDTQLGPTKAEFISEIAQRSLISESVLLPSVRDVSMFAVKGHNQISFPKRSTSFSIEDRASATEGTTQDVDFLKDTLDLNRRAHLQWRIDSDDELESRLDVQREYIEMAAREHAVDVDRQLISEMESRAIITTTVAALPGQALILEMRQVMLQNKARPGDLYFAVSPAGEAALLGVDTFVSADKYGAAVIPSGVLGTIYGVKIVMSPELGDDQYFMYASEGIAVGFQRRPQFDSRKAPELGVGAELQVLAQKYGVEGLHQGVPGAFKADGSTALGATESALIIKDANV